MTFLSDVVVFGLATLMMTFAIMQIIIPLIVSAIAFVFFAAWFGNLGLGVRT